MILGPIYYLRPSKAVLLTQQVMIRSLKQQQLRPLRFCVERERETVQMHTLLSDKLLGRVSKLLIKLSVKSGLCGLAIEIYKYLKAKEELLKLKYFHHAKI
jgi:hypothetical protein